MTKEIEILKKDVLANNSKDLASLGEFMKADRCVGSIFDGFLQPGDQVRLKEGVFILDQDLDPVCEKAEPLITN